MTWLAVAAAAAALLGESLAAAQDRPVLPPGPESSAVGPRIERPPSAALSPAPDRPPSPEVDWDPRWPRFRPAEYVATGVLFAASAGSFAIRPDPSRWTAPNDLDVAVRSGLRIRSERQSGIAKDASDVLITLMINHLTADALFVTWWHHGRRSVALELLLMDAEALALATAVQGLVAGLVSRQRPFGVECVGPEEQQPERCRSSNRYRSFFSGHTTAAFTSAGLVCAHHARLPLYGGGAADKAACAGALVTAAAVGTLRVVADQHYATDVLAGATWGTLVGLGLPWLLHYRGGAAPAADAARASRSGGVTLRFAPAPLGGAVVGSF